MYFFFYFIVQISDDYLITPEKLPEYLPVEKGISYGHTYKSVESHKLEQHKQEESEEPNLEKDLYQKQIEESMAKELIKEEVSKEHPNSNVKDQDLDKFIEDDSPYTIDHKALNEIEDN